jgi:hypothetical protein
LPPKKEEEDLEEEFKSHNMPLEQVEEAPMMNRNRT